MFQQMTYTDAYINFISVTRSPHNAITTIGQYQRINRPIPIISKTADNWPIPLTDYRCISNLKYAAVKMKTTVQVNENHTD